MSICLIVFFLISVCLTSHLGPWAWLPRACHYTPNTRSHSLLLSMLFNLFQSLSVLTTLHYVLFSISLVAGPPRSRPAIETRDKYQEHLTSYRRLVFNHGQRKWAPSSYPHLQYKMLFPLARRKISVIRFVLILLSKHWTTVLICWTFPLIASISNKNKNSDRENLHTNCSIYTAQWLIKPRILLQFRTWIIFCSYLQRSKIQIGSWPASTVTIIVTILSSKRCHTLSILYNSPNNHSQSVASNVRWAFCHMNYIWLASAWLTPLKRISPALIIILLSQKALKGPVTWWDRNKSEKTRTYKHHIISQVVSHLTPHLTPHSYNISSDQISSVSSRQAKLAHAQCDHFSLIVCLRRSPIEAWDPPQK